MSQKLHDLGIYIAKAYPKAVLDVYLKNGELVLWVEKQNLREFVHFLRTDAECLFEQLTDICGVDYPSKTNRFEVVYHLLSLRHNHRLRLKVSVKETEPVPSLVSLFECAGWYEREAWDLYGVHFEGNPDLRRILTDYGFQGHPLRKDFPLTGHVEVRYSEEEKKVVYEPVSLPQEFRRFDFLSPWEGMQNVLHGDEKAGHINIRSQVPQEETP
jgi:NADH-quinone oxidoreductase subunit C